MAAKLSPRPKKGERTDKTPMAGRLTAQQELFVEALFERNFHLQDAAIAAGCKKVSASQQACRWMQMPAVEAAIAKKREMLRNTQEVDSRRIVQELARIGLFNPKMLLRPDGKGVMDLKDMPDDVAAVISNITVSYGEDVDGDGNFHRLKNIRLQFHDKLSALSQLSNLLGLSNGGATTVINNNTLNQLVVKWDELYKKQAALPAHDPVEARISAEEAAQSSLSSPPEIEGTLPKGELIINEETVK